MAALDKGKTYHNENGSEVTIHEVQERGEIISYGGSVIPVREGTMVASTGRPDEFYVVNDISEWTAGEASELDTYSDENEDARDSGPEVFDPNAHSASEVKEYLSRSDLTNDEYARVMNLERAGKNRSSAIPNS